MVGVTPEDLAAASQLLATGAGDLSKKDWTKRGCLLLQSPSGGLSGSSLGGQSCSTGRRTWRSQGPEGRTCA